MRPKSLEAERGHAFEGIARTLREIAQPHGYALLLFDAGEVLYASTGERADVVKMLRAWAKKVGGFAPHDEPRRVRSKRKALEHKCAEIGRALAQEGELVFFLFDLGVAPGNVAYFTNRPNAAADVALWLAALAQLPAVPLTHH
jgi:hypothetical protein